MGIFNWIFGGEDTKVQDRDLEIATYIKDTIAKTLNITFGKLIMNTTGIFHSYSYKSEYLELNIGKSYSSYHCNIVDIPKDSTDSYRRTSNILYIMDSKEDLNMLDRQINQLIVFYKHSKTEAYKQEQIAKIEEEYNDTIKKAESTKARQLGKINNVL